MTSQPVRKDVLAAAVRVIVAARAVAEDPPRRTQKFTTRVRSTLIRDLREALEAWDATA